MINSRSLPLLALISITAVALAGCVGGGQDSRPPAVTIDDVSVPDSMAAPDAVVGADSTIAVASGSLPWMFGGSSSSGAQGGQPTAWTSSDGLTWTATPVDSKFDGSFSGDLAASDDLAALAGVVWNDGVSRSALWTSTNRLKWSSVALPGDWAMRYRVVDAAVSGTTTLLVGIDTEGASSGLRISDGKAIEFALPKVADDYLLSPSTLVTSDKTLVLVADPGPEGDPAPTVAYVSDDLGSSWGKSSPIVDQLGFVSGVAVISGGFVATGGTPRDTNGGSGPAAWSSPDGVTWTPDTVPGPPDDGPLFFTGDADAGFGAPLANGATVGAVFYNDNAAVSGVYRRDPAGAWLLVGQTSENPGNGVSGVAMPVEGGSMIVRTGGSGYLRSGILTGGSYSDSAIFAARQDVATASTVYDTRNDPRLGLVTSTFTVDSDLGWRNSSTYGLGAIDDGALNAIPWDPARVGDLTNVQLAADDSGAEVVIGSFFPPGVSAILVEGWYRSGPDQPWTAATGFDVTGATFFYGVEYVGGQWIAIGQNRPSAAVADTDHGVIWSSTDGITWTRPAGAFGDGALETSVNDVCELPSGDPVAVGWVEESSGNYRTSAWTPTDGTWARAEIGELGTKSGSAYACATGDAGVIMAASVSGRDTLQLSTDGSTWKQVFRADRGMSLGEPVAVPGGFAASGSLANSSFDGPVVWLSSDGTSWSPVSIPSYRPGETLAVAPYGKDLLVTMSSRVGQPVSIVRDIGKVIADNKG